MRTYVVTGAASGIGKATKSLLEARGNRVIGVDIRDAEVEVDLSNQAGRNSLVDEVTKISGGKIDAILAIAGLASPTPPTVAVNYFGMVGTLIGLRPLLLGSAAPRAAAISSMASIMPFDSKLVELELAGDETGAIARAVELAKSKEEENLIYSSTKAGFARWIRRNAATAEWAGAHIPLNAIAPGVVLTPMTAPLMQTTSDREQLLKTVPMPLNGLADPIAPARLLAWLTSEENTHLCGQVIFIDGGSDVVFRGDSVW